MSEQERTIFWVGFAIGMVCELIIGFIVLILFN